MEELMAKVMPICDIHDRRDWPDSCNANIYEHPYEACPFHADNEALFNLRDERQNAGPIRIISLSLGATRGFVIRQSFGEDVNRRQSVTHQLADGDLAIMDGLFQDWYQHSVSKGYACDEERINLTWRWVLNHKEECKFPTAAPWAGHR